MNRPQNVSMGYGRRRDATTHPPLASPYPLPPVVGEGDGPEVLKVGELQQPLGEWPLNLAQATWSVKLALMVQL